MCGIFGILNFEQNLDIHKAQGSLNLINHRGPDASDSLFKQEKKFQLFLGHKRLKIIDLSSLSNQPFTTIDGRFTLVFNGEIYNYQELREELQSAGFRFISTGDTEVVANAFAYWGKKCFSRLNGMWALAIYDHVEKKLTLSRDRFGIKPLYYSKTKNEFIFGSEIKTILPFLPSVLENSDGVAKFLLLSIIDDGEDTLFSGVSQLGPGWCLEFDQESLFTSYQYWCIESDLGNKQEKDIVHKFRDAFFQAVDRHLISDVPVGIQLSGGLDSSSIAVTLLGHKKIPLDSFSIVYEEEKFSEKKYVEAIKQKYPELNAHFISPDLNSLEVDVKRLIYSQDLPTRSLAVLMQSKLYQYVTNNTSIKVILAGQGGDEILGGYVEHQFQYLLQLISDHKFQDFFEHAKWHIKSRGVSDFSKLFGDKIVKTLFPISPKSYLGLNDLGYSFIQTQTKRASNFVLNEMINNQTKSSLREYLRYEDRNSMAYSIESRVPFLDHELYKLAMNISPSEQMGLGKTKQVLRGAVADLMPKEILNRSDKMGFSTPHIEWFPRYLLDDLRELFYANISNPFIFCLKSKFDMYFKTKNGDHYFWWRVYNYLVWKNIFNVGH